MRFTDVLHGEIVKARTSRALVLTVLAAIVLGLAYSTLEATPDLGFSTPQSAGVYAMANFSFFAAIVGVLITSSEYAGGQVTTTSLVVPRRGRVIAAKLVLSTAVTTVLGLLLAVLIATIVQAPLKDRSVYATGTEAALFSSLALAVLSWTGLGIISTSIAFLIRSQTVALSVMIVLSFGGTPLMMALPILQYLPTNAGVLMFIDRANQTSDWLNPPDITVSAAAFTLTVWCVAAISTASAVVLHRDIGQRSATVD